MEAEAQRNIAAHNALKAEVDKVARRYKRAWHELCDTADLLMGIGAALAPMTRDEDPIIRSTVAFSVPKFGLPSHSSGGTYSPTFTHLSDEWTTDPARRDGRLRSTAFSTTRPPTLPT